MSVETVKEEKPKPLGPAECGYCASSRWESLHSEYKGCVYCRQSSESPLKDFKNWPNEDKALYREWMKLREERDACFKAGKPFLREKRFQLLTAKD